MNILITGGASGLGKDITKRLALNGENQVFFTFRSSKVESEEITKAFLNSTAIQCDFTSEESVNELIERMGSMQIDVLINNAYTSIEKKHFHKISKDIFQLSFTNNILPTLLITQKALEIFRKAKKGKIITILSSYVIGKPPIGMSEYVASKNYLLSMSRSWATENSSFNITSNCISPSIMRTNLTKDTDERVLSEMEKSHPLKKLLMPSEVAEAVVFFTECTQHTNGLNHLINAGLEIY